jgi:hypothetical protein
MQRIKDIAVIVILSLTLQCALNLPLSAQEEEKEERPTYSARHYPVNLSLWYPVSINRTPQDSANINFTLLYGRIGTVQGLDLAVGGSVLEQGLQGIQIAGLAGIAGNRTSGLQVSGLTSITGDALIGAQISGLVSITGDAGRGFQIAGLANISGDRLTGLQASGLFNVVGEEFKGAQVVGGFNVVGDSCVGFQAAGLFNVVGDRFKGLQASGLFNVVGDDLTGVQVGTFNVAPYMSHAAQIGIVNVSAEMRGFQLGVVNWNGETYGVPVGLANISKRDGYIRWISWGSSISGINSGAKFEVGRIYSIVALGYWNFLKDKGSALSYAGYYGMTLYQGQDLFSIGADVGYMYMDNKTIFKSNPDMPDQHVLMGRGHVRYDISSRISLIGGAGLSYIADRHRPFSDGRFRPLFFIGLEAF